MRKRPSADMSVWMAARSICDVSPALIACSAWRPSTTTLCRMMPMPMLWKSLSVKEVASRFCSLNAWHLLQRARVLKSSQPRLAASSMAVESPAMKRSNGESNDSCVRSYEAMARSRSRALGRPPKTFRKASWYSGMAAIRATAASRLGWPISTLDALGERVHQVTLLVEQKVQLVKGRSGHLPVMLPVHVRQRFRVHQHLVEILDAGRADRSIERDRQSGN